MKTKCALALGTWFGCGYSPKAPGTVGSVAALAIAIALHDWVGLGSWGLLGLSVVSLAPFIWAAQETSRVTGSDDPQIVVADEVVGQWIALGGATAWNWKSYLAALALFRLFDIWKPAPVRQLERLHGGVGIIADDVMAGVYAALVLLLAGCFNLY
jgi:phosphatidylglycerophosphatase A